MKPLSDQTHYEVLEVGRDATPEKIERAYRIARATYSQGSIAIYSMFGAEDARALRRRIELAYEVLSDAAARRRYEETLESGPPAAEPPPAPSPHPEPLREAEAPALEAFPDLHEDDSGAYDGPRLRRARLARELEIQQISSTTKINPNYLHYIEEERFDALPAPVYVRGFVAAYARVVGLDPHRVAASYMERFGQDPRLRRRSRLPGRS